MASGGEIGIRLFADASRFNAGLRRAEEKLRVTANHMARFTSRLQKTVPTAFSSLGARVQQASIAAGQGLQRFGRALDGVHTKLRNLGLIATFGFTLGVSLFAKSMVGAAQDAEETASLFGVALDKLQDQGEQFVTEMNRALALDPTPIRKYLGTLQVMLKSMGVGEEAALGMSASLSQLTYDMASFFNLEVDEAFGKIRAGLVGSAEPLQQLGIIVKEATIEQTALRLGLIQQGEKMNETQKVMARYVTLMDSTKDAQGDLSRTIASSANQQRLFGERWGELKTKIGQVLLEAYDPFIKKMNVLTQAFLKLSPESKRFAVIMVAIAAAVGPVLLALGALVATIKVTSIIIGSVLVGLGSLIGAIKVVGVAVAAAAAVMGAPWVLAAATVIAVVGAIIYWSEELVDAWNWVKDKLTNVFDWIVDRMPDLWPDDPEVGGMDEAISKAHEDLRDTAGTETEETASYLESLGETVQDALKWTSEKVGFTDLNNFLEDFSSQIKTAQATVSQAGTPPDPTEGLEEKIKASFEESKLDELKRRGEDLLKTFINLDERGKLLGDSFNVAGGKASALKEHLIALIAAGFRPGEETFDKLALKLRDLTQEGVLEELAAGLRIADDTLTVFGDEAAHTPTQIKLVEKALRDLIAAGIDPSSDVVKGLQQQFNELKSYSRTEAETLGEMERNRKAIAARSSLDLVLGDEFTTQKAQLEELKKTLQTLADASIQETGALPTNDAFKGLLDSYKALKATLTKDEIMVTLDKQMVQSAQRTSVLGASMDEMRIRANHLRSAIIKLAELGVDPLDKDLDALRKQFKALTREMTLGPVLERVETALRNAELEAKLFGTTSELTAKKIGILQQELRNLIANKVGPGDSAFDTLIEKLGQLKASTIKSVTAEFEKAMGKLEVQGRVFGKTFDLAGQKADWLRSKLVELIDKGVRPGDQEFDKLWAAFRGFQKDSVLNELEQGMQRIQRNLEVFGDKGKATSESIDLLSRVINNLLLHLDKSDPIIQRLIAQLAQLKQQAKMDEKASATKEIFKTLETQLQDSKERSAVFGSSLDEAKKRATALNQALVALAEQGLTLQDAKVRDLKDRYEKLSASISQTEILSRVREGMEQSAQQTEVFGDTVGQLYNQINIVKTGLTDLLNEGIGPGNAEFDALFEKLQNLEFKQGVVEGIEAIGQALKQSFSQTVSGVLQGTQTMSEAFANLGQNILAALTNAAITKAIDSLFSGLSKIGAGGGGFLSSIFSALGFAAEGGVHTGMTVVGEKGPELVDFDRPTRVYTADQTQNLLRGGAAPQYSLHVTNHVQSSDGPGVRQALGEVLPAAFQRFKEELIIESGRPSTFRGASRRR